MSTTRLLSVLKRTGITSLRVILIIFFLLSAMSLPQARVEAAPVSLLASFSAEPVADTYLRQSQPTRNYGATTLISSSPNNTYRQNPLYLWNLTSIPTNATVQSASITFYVTEASNYDFSLFRMRRTWVEGTSDDVASTTSANWNTYNGVNSWGTAGAMNTTTDRYNTDLWDATASTFGTTGTVTIPLNASGVAAVQAWVTTPSSNYGATFQYTGTSTESDYWVVASRENTSYAGATLNVTYDDGITPSIYTAGTLTAFTSTPGTPSAQQSYTVSGSYLTAPILITPPTDFEISLTSGSGFSSTPISLTPVSGTVASTTIYVRFNRVTNGTSSGNITHTSTGATTVNVAVSGTASFCSVVQLTAVEDTYVSAANTNYNNGGNVEIHVDNTTGTARRGALLRWDVSSIPSNATVSAASLILNIINVSPLQFNLYNMRRDWVEGTSSQAASSTSANWNTYDGVNNWGTAGISNTTTDRYNTNLWSASTTSFTATGSRTEALNSSGVAVVQGWINGSLPNYGLTMQNYVTATSNAVYFSSSEVTTAANRPQMSVSYCIPDPRPSATVTFQYGTAGYTGTVDTYLLGSTEGDTNHHTETDLQWDDNTDTTTDEIALIRFDNLFVSQGGSIPDGAIISSASLTYMTTDLNSGSTAEGNPANVYESLVAWTGSTVTYNNFGGDAGVQADEYNATPVVSAPATARSTPFTIDVTDSVQDWSDAPATNLGWIFLSTGTDGVNIYSSDYATVANRPLLSVTYVLPSTCYVLTLSHSGNGTTPTATPGNSSGCTAGTYLAGANITLSGAVPDSGWSISGWTGTTNNSSTGSSNTVVMPAADHATSVIYTEIPPTCYALSLSHSGNGTTPTANPANSTGCTAGNYVSGETIALSGAVPDSGWSISGWTGTTNNSSTASTNSVLMPAAAHAASVIYADINDAPNAPVLVQPADDSTNIATSPTLQVTVSDPDSNPMNVSFYGRPVDGGTGEEFMIVLLPDTQNESQYAPAMFTSQTNWISTNRVANNIEFVIGLGDVVNNANSTTEYTNADTAIDILDAGGVWYMIAPGNHDYPGYSSPVRYGDYFGNLRYAGYQYSSGYWFGGAYDTYNTYSLFSAGGMDFILISLQYQPTTAILNWADALLTTYSDRRAIVEQHDILNIDNSWVNQASYNALRDHDNLFLMVSGHMHSGSDGAAYVAGTGTGGAGQTIHVVQADYQDMSNGNGWLRLLRFAPADDTIYMTTYSPYTGGSITTSPDQMNLAYPMDAAEPFTLIGTAAGVASGSNASVTWNGLAQDTEYEWYAVASDGTLQTQSTTWSFTTGVGNNVAPVITEGASTSVTMSEDGSPTPFSLTLNATDANPGDTLTWSVSSAASHGTATAAGTGASVTVGYTPTANYNGSDSFVVQVSDGFGGTDTITVNVTIQAVNDPPTDISLSGTSVAENSATNTVVGTFSATDPDTGDTFTYSLVTGSGDTGNGSFNISGTSLRTSAVFNYEAQSSYSIRVQVTDSGSATYEEVFTITITNVNEAPVLGAIGSQSIAEGSLLTFTAAATDPDVPAQTLTFSLVGAPTGASITTGGVFTWTPTEAQGPGSYPFTVSVCDNGSPVLCDTEDITVTVSEVNVAPVLGAIGPQSVAEGSLLTFTATATDADLPAQTLAFSLVGAPTGASITTGGVFTWTPTEAQGPASYTFTVRVCDNFSTPACDTEDITVTVTEGNAAPVLDAIGPQSMAEGSLLTFTAIATDADLPAQTLTFSLVGAPTGASITAGGVFTWTPTEAQGPGSYPFTVQVCDNGSPVLCDTEGITVTVSEVNVAPVLAAIGNRSVNEGTLLTFTATATDADLPAQTLAFSLVGAPAGASITSGGVFTWTPTEAQGGSDYTFTVQVCDNYTTPACDTETITVTVNKTNTAPVLGAIGPQSVAELATLSFTATATDADLPAQTLAFSLVGAPTGAAIDPVTGVFTWTPTEAQGAGSYTFTVRVCDNFTTPACDTEDITVTVSEVNVAPVLGAIGPQSVAELATLSFTATATDADLPAQTLAFSLVGAPTGAAIDPVTGVFTWTPTEAQGAGSYTFTVRVCDNFTTPACDTEDITVTVSEVNVAPILVAIGPQSVAELATLSFTATATDADLPAQTLAFSLVGAPTGAAIDPVTGVFTWTPTEAQGAGSYTFTVRVCDNFTTPACDTEDITVTVSEVNVAPILGAIGPQSVAELATLSFTATATDTDLPAQTLAFSLVGAPTGAAIDPVTGVFTWTPTEAQGAGSYSFTVRVCDNFTTPACDTEDITVTVSEVNVAPVITETDPVSVTMSVNGVPNPFSLTLHATDADLPANTLTWSILTPALHGTASASGTGTSMAIGYTPNTDYAGSDTFVVQVSDGNGGTDTITVNVTISPVTYTISGTTGLAGVTLTYPGGSAVSGLGGAYSFTVPYDWSGTVIASLDGYTFTPSSRTYTNVQANQTAQDYLPTQIEYTLTVVSAHGTVTRVPDQATYHYGDVVQLTAAPAAGWAFVNWTGDVSSTLNPVSITITGNMTVTANYSQIEYTLTVVSAHGTVTRVPDQATYHYGDIVQLTAAPAAGWAFSGWTGDVSSTLNPVSVTITGNMTVTANYSQIEYTLTVVSAHGTVTRVPDQATYHYGDIVQLTAAPAAGWAFVNWTGDITSSLNPVSVTITGNMTVTANYIQEGYTLTIISAHGTVTANPDQNSYNYGDVVQLTAVPAAGWYFSGWTGDVVSTDNPLTITITGNMTLTANYGTYSMWLPVIMR